MIFDTGSNWLWVDSKDCETCPQYLPKFNETQSTTLVIDPEPRALHYGRGAVKCKKAHDTICLN